MVSRLELVLDGASNRVMVKFAFRMDFLCFCDTLNM